MHVTYVGGNFSNVIITYGDLDSLFETVEWAMEFFEFLLFWLEAGYLIHLVHRHGCWEFSAS